MDLTSNELYRHINRLIKNIILSRPKPHIPSISIKSRKNQNNIIIEEENIEKYFIMIILNESNISNFIYNSSMNQKINMYFNKLEYLSLTNNYLININFIVNFPELFYLDVLGNPLVDFNGLNDKNIFGYLRLTVEKFNEKKVLSIKGLNCIILDFDIKDKNTLKYFKLNNPNIIMLNNEIIYYVDILKDAEIRKGTKRMRTIKRNVMNLMANNSNEIKNKNPKLDLNKKNSLYSFNSSNKNNNRYQSHPNINLEFSSKKDSKSELQNKPDNLKLKNINADNNIKITNPNLLEIKNFFEELYQILAKIKKKALGRINSKMIYEEKSYLNVEKKRLLLLNKTYMKINAFNKYKKKNKNEIYIKNIDAIYTNKFCDAIKIYEVKKYIKCININIRFGIIILISMLFYCLNLISMKMAITIIHYLMLKYYKFDEHQQFQYFNSFGNIHYLCYYFDNLEDFKTKLKFAEKSQIELYQKILDILEIPQLILKVNKLYQKKFFFTKNKNISQKNKISILLSDIRELDLEKDIFILIEFFCDFIQYENIEQHIINGSENDEYSTMIEIKEMLEQNELEKNNIYLDNLSAKKFYKNKLESTFNKFFFENNKIKIVKNRTFKDIHDNKKSYYKNKLNLISFYQNWNKEYEKVDEISTKNCLTIDKFITRRKINNNKDNIFKKYKSTEYNKGKKLFSPGTKNIGLNTNIFSNKTINKRFNINSNIEPNLYCKTINFRNVNIPEVDKFERNYSMGKTYQNKFISFSPNNRFNKNYKSIVASRTQNRNNFKLFSNYFIQNSQKSNEEIIKNKFLKTYLLNKSSKHIKIKENNNDDEKLNTLNIKRINDIREKENPRVSINAYRLYEKMIKNKSKNKKEKNETYNDDLLVEKYNQIKQSNIIRKIIEQHNKFLQEKLKKANNKVKSD